MHYKKIIEYKEPIELTPTLITLGLGEGSMRVLQTMGVWPNEED